MFIKEESSRVVLEECYEVVERCSVWIPIVVKSSAFIKNITS